MYHASRSPACAVGPGRPGNCPSMIAFPHSRRCRGWYLARYPSPVERVERPGGGSLWLKRDDQNAPGGGRQQGARAGVPSGTSAAGRHVLTAGGDGSTHVYATAVHAARLGARAVAVRWRHDMHPEARGVAYGRSHALRTRSDRTAGPRLRSSASGCGEPGSPLVCARCLGRGYRTARRTYRSVAARHSECLATSTPASSLPSKLPPARRQSPPMWSFPLGSGGTAAGLAIALGSRGWVPSWWPFAWRRERSPMPPESAALIRGTLGLSGWHVGGPPRRLRVAPVVVDHSATAGLMGGPLAAGAHAATLFRALYDSNAPRSRLLPCSMPPTRPRRRCRHSRMAERGPRRDTCHVLWRRSTARCRRITEPDAGRMQSRATVITLPTLIAMAYDDVGTGPAVVFLHGFPHDRSLWAAQLSAFADRARCVAPDLRGFGGSTATAPCSMDQYADDVAALLDALSIPRRGRRRTVDGRRTSPSRSGADIGCGSARSCWRIRVQPQTTRRCACRRRRLVAVARSEGSRAVADLQIAPCSGATTRARNPTLVTTTHRMLALAPVAGIVGALEAMMNRPDSMDLLSTIDVPTLIIAGDEDTDHSQHRRLARCTRQLRGAV